MWPGPYGEWGSRKYLLASLDQSLARMGLDYVDIFYSHRFDPDTPLEETLGALDTAVRQGKALYAGISSYSAERTREAAAHPARARHAAADPPAVLLDAQPLDRARAARRARRRGHRRIVFSPLGQGMLTDKYLDGVPEDSRAAQDRFLKRDFLTEENLARVRALNEIAQRPRPGARADGDRLDAARPARHLGADRRVERRAARAERRRARATSTFSDDELAEIDRHAVDAGINLWAESSDA